MWVHVFVTVTVTWDWRFLWRHHIYKSIDGRIELKEIGPRFELFCMFLCFTPYINFEVTYIPYYPFITLTLLIGWQEWHLANQKPVPLVHKDSVPEQLEEGNEDVNHLAQVYLENGG